MARHREFWPVVALIALVFAAVVSPGDAPWINDEPQLMQNAIDLNATPGWFCGIRVPFTPGSVGLRGTRGANYGPLALWTDQIFLAFTHNPVVMVAIRAGFFAAINALALYWLAKTLGVSPWLAVAAMSSPWLWLNARPLWDNSLCIPISAMMLAAYADFLVNGRAWSLRLTAVCGFLLLLLHFMAIPLIATIAIHLLIFENRKLWRFKGSLAAILVLFLIISWPYWNFLLHNYKGTVPGGTVAWRGLLFPFWGAHLLALTGLAHAFGDGWQDQLPVAVRGMLTAAQWISLLAYAAVWSGMILAIPRCWRAIRHPQQASPTDHFFGVAWTVFVFQCVMDGLLHVYEGPHYHNATWTVPVVFAFLAADSLWRSGRKQAFFGIVLSAYVGLRLLALAIIAVVIHQDGGMRTENYGTSLTGQITAVQEMQKYSEDSPRQIEYAGWIDHPQALAVLEKLSMSAGGIRSRRDLIVQYRDEFPGDARIAVIAR